jgi:fused signal recognition particle receptor
MFSAIRQMFRTMYTHFSSQISRLLGHATLDETTLHELERLLLSADTGVPTTRYILEQLKKTSNQETTLTESLQTILCSILQSVPAPVDKSKIYLLVGINGSGKTTCAGKLAHHYVQQGKKVLLVAADTFRAAAPDQLQAWAQRAGASLTMGTSLQDPASLVFTGCERFVQEQFDILIIDTAGRLQTKTNLMQELAKIKRILLKKLPYESMCTLLTIDAMLGQNSLEQAALFKECTDVSGIVLTKTDGTGKGGIIFAIAHTLHIPVLYACHGEKITDILPFNAKQYVHELIYERI